MSYDNQLAFEKALELAKEYVRSESAGHPAEILEAIYNKIVAIAKAGGFFSEEE